MVLKFIWWWWIPPFGAQRNSKDFYPNPVKTRGIRVETLKAVCNNSKSIQAWTLCMFSSQLLHTYVRSITRRHLQYTEIIVSMNSSRQKHHESMQQARSKQHPSGTAWIHAYYIYNIQIWDLYYHYCWHYDYYLLLVLHPTCAGTTAIMQGWSVFWWSLTKYLAIRVWLSACLSGQLTWWRMTCYSNLFSGIIMWVPSESKRFHCKICAGSGRFWDLVGC